VGTTTIWQSLAAIVRRGPVVNLTAPRTKNRIAGKRPFDEPALGIIPAVPPNPPYITSLRRRHRPQRRQPGFFRLRPLIRNIDPVHLAPIEIDSLLGVVRPVCPESHLYRHLLDFYNGCVISCGNMRWIKDAPTQDGYYWYRDIDNPSVMVRVSELAANGATLACLDWNPHEISVDGDDALASLYPGEWAGPIQPPAESLRDVFPFKTGDRVRMKNGYEGNVVQIEVHDCPPRADPRFYATYTVRRFYESHHPFDFETSSLKLQVEECQCREEELTPVTAQPSA
jgi:hypothetical protein